MQGKESDVIGGVNKFIGEQKAADGSAVLTVVQFDDKYEPEKTVEIGAAKEWTTHTYKPRGSTALLDAVGRAMNDVGAEVSKSSIKVDKVIVTIVTDGQENASREFTYERIKDMIKHAESNGWTFLFLGADPSSWRMASAMGISAQNFAATESALQGAAYASASFTAAQVRSGKAVSVNLQQTYDANTKTAH